MDQKFCKECSMAQDWTEHEGYCTVLRCSISRKTRVCKAFFYIDAVKTIAKSFSTGGGERNPFIAVYIPTNLYKRIKEECGESKCT